MTPRCSQLSQLTCPRGLTFAERPPLSLYHEIAQGHGRIGRRAARPPGAAPATAPAPQSTTRSVEGQPGRAEGRLARGLAAAIFRAHPSLRPRWKISTGGVSASAAPRANSASRRGAGSAVRAGLQPHAARPPNQRCGRRQVRLPAGRRLPSRPIRSWPACADTPSACAGGRPGFRCMPGRAQTGTPANAFHLGSCPKQTAYVPAVIP